MTKLTFNVIGGTGNVTLEDFTLVVAGYTGRNQADVQHHIDELLAIGIPAPESVPSFYVLPASLATSATEVELEGSNTSGEVEPVLIRHNGRVYLGVGSDHTDRDMERDSISDSKAACVKPVSSSIFALPKDSSGFPWDSVVAECTVDGATYQKGTLSSLRIPTDVLSLYGEKSGNTEGDLILFGGTLPLLDGKFVPGTNWHLSLGLPNGVTLSHNYSAEVAVRSSRP